MTYHVIHLCLQALALVDYDDILAPADVHSLIALISALHQAFFQCSKVTVSHLHQFDKSLLSFVLQAFVVLQSLDSISDERRGQLGELSLEIFTRQELND